MKNKLKRWRLPSLFCAFMLFVAPFGASACGVENLPNSANSSSNSSSDNSANSSSDNSANSSSEAGLDGVTITQTSTVEYDYSVLPAYKEFASIAKSEYLVPGLAEGIVPQGMDVWNEKDLLLISGYFYNNTSGSPSSMIVAIDLKTGEHAGSYCLENIDGTPHTSHVGGLAVTEKNIFIANNNQLFRIPLSQMELLGRSGTLKIVESIKVPTRASFCNYSDGVIWVGDFQDESGSYETPEWRYMTNNDGKLYKAWAVGYKVKDTESEFSSENWDSSTMEYATPDYVLSIRKQIQGMTFVGDQIVLSRSYGRTNDSNLYVYNSPLKNEQDTSVMLNDKSVPVWFLDSGVFVKDYTTMSMSEGVTCYNDKVLVLFETGTKKYRNAKSPTDHVWSVALPAQNQE